MRMLNWIRTFLGRRGSSFDGEACVAILADKTQHVVDRDAAAESLMWYPKQSACNALLRVIVDDNEDDNLRHTAATSLGVIWNEIGIDQSKLQMIPENLQVEVLSNITTQHGA